MTAGRYLPWRHAVRRPVWAIDRHWYALLSLLCEESNIVVIDLRDDELAPTDVGGHCRVDPIIDPEPYVCPGCYAVGEPCAPGCIDAEIEREREEAIERGDYDRSHDDDEGR